MALWAESKVVWKWGKAAGDGGVTLAAAGPRPVRRARLRLRRSRPAALGLRGLRLAGPPVCKGVRWPAPARGAIPAEMEGVHDRAGRGGRGTAVARDRDCPALAGLGRRRAIRGGRGTAAARHPRAPRWKGRGDEKWGMSPLQK